MLLNLNKNGIQMKRVYHLSDDLKIDTEQVALTQALTLDSSRPLMGLKGTHGLFASPEWWANIDQKKMPLSFISGVIQRTYIAGQDNGDEPNGMILQQDDGSTQDVGIYVNTPTDIPLFKPGSLVEVVYVLDELKRQPGADGNINYSKIALEMTVSLKPIGLS